MASSKRSGSSGRGRGSGGNRSGGRVTPKKDTGPPPRGRAARSTAKTSGRAAKSTAKTSGRAAKSTDKTSGRAAKSTDKTSDRAAKSTDKTSDRAAKSTGRAGSSTTSGPPADADRASPDASSARSRGRRPTAVPKKRRPAGSSGADETAGSVATTAAAGATAAAGWRSTLGQWGTRFGLTSPTGEGATTDEPVAEVADAEPEEDEIGPDGLRRVRWGLGDVALGLGIAILAGSIIPLLLLPVLGYALNLPAGRGAALGMAVGQAATSQPVNVKEIPLWLSGLLQVPYWGGFLGVTAWAVHTKGNGLVRDLGLRFRRIDIPVGLVVGVVSQVVVIGVVYALLFLLIGEKDVGETARQLTDRASDPLGVVTLFLIVGVFAPFTEEIYFRGLTQRSVDRRFGPRWALFGTAAFFAVTHFNLLLLLGEFAIGLILGWMVKRTGRLGPAICTHVAFNCTAATAQLLHIGV